PAVGVAELLEWRSRLEMARSGVPLISAQLSVGKIKQGVRFSLGRAEPARLISRAPIQLIGLLESAQPAQHPRPEVGWSTLEATGPLALHLRLPGLDGLKGVGGLTQRSQGVNGRHVRGNRDHLKIGRVQSSDSGSNQLESFARAALVTAQEAEVHPRRYCGARIVRERQGLLQPRFGVGQLAA